MSKDFINIKRIDDVYRPVDERKSDYHEVEREFSVDELREQAARCMNCGIPFCHGAGCPLNNIIPEINAAVHKKNFEGAWELLSSTSQMPEFTSRVCPALCEGSCTAGISLEPVMVRQLEKLVVETAFKNNWVKPDNPVRNGKKIAVIGAGPAGLAAAIKLNSLGYKVTVFERNAKAGGLLRYGIPPFKLAKSVIDRRIKIMEQSGIEFTYHTAVGKDISMDYLTRHFDAVVVCCGTPEPRDLKAPGRETQGIYFALDFLNGAVSAKDRNVLIIGGGDTGSDCVGLSVRQEAKSILQIEIMPEPPQDRSESTPWPLWPYKLRTSSSQKEGGDRRWSLQTNKFISADGKITGVEVQQVKWELTFDGRPVKFSPVPGTEEVIKADLVFLAMGFLKPEHKYDAANVFVAGDAANGPSLVVRAMAHAKDIAQKAHDFLVTK